MWPIGFPLNLPQLDLMQNDQFSRLFNQNKQLMEVLLTLNPLFLNPNNPMMMPFDLNFQKGFESTQQTPLYPPVIEQVKNSKLQRIVDDSKKIKKTQCENRFCDKTTDQCTQTKIGEDLHTFCLLCYQNYKDNYFCEYCFQVLDSLIQVFDPMDDDEIDDKEWIQCESCDRWNHIECEQNHGINNIKKIKRNANYYCKECRNKPIDERVVVPVVKKLKQTQIKKEPQQQEFIPTINFKVQSVNLKLSENEILQDLGELRGVVYIQQNNVPQQRKTTRIKKQRLY